jgi:hypothetical protein
MSNDDSTTTTATTGTWVAMGAAGAVGSIYRTHDGFAIRVGNEPYHGAYPTLDVAKSALHAKLGSGLDRPEFVEH